MIKNSAIIHDTDSPAMINTTAAYAEARHRGWEVGENVRGKDATHGVYLHDPKTKKMYAFKVAFERGFLKSAMSNGVDLITATQLLKIANITHSVSGR